MAKFTRGFLGRGTAGARIRGCPRPVRHRARWPVLTAEPTPRLDTATWTFRVEGLVTQPTTWTWEQIQGPAAIHLRGRHPLRHHLVEAGDHLHRGVRRHAAGCGDAPPRGHPCPGLLAHRLHHQYAPGRRDRGPGLGGVGRRREPLAARTRRAGSAAGPAPVLLEERQVGRRACVCSTMTNRGSGNRTAITIVVTPGSSSAIRVTEGPAADRRESLADGHRYGHPHETPPPRRSGLGSGTALPAPGWPALHRPSDRARRLHAPHGPTRWPPPRTDPRKSR